jgi:hypothetical protein
VWDRKAKAEFKEDLIAKFMHGLPTDDLAPTKNKPVTKSPATKKSKPAAKSPKKRKGPPVPATDEFDDDSDDDASLLRTKAKKQKPATHEALKLEPSEQQKDHMGKLVKKLMHPTHGAEWKTGQFNQFKLRAAQLVLWHGGNPTDMELDDLVGLLHEHRHKPKAIHKDIGTMFNPLFKTSAFYKATEEARKYGVEYSEGRYTLDDQYFENLTPA